MNLYLVYRKDKIGWDEFDSIVCVAEHIEDARLMKPSYFLEIESEYCEVDCDNLTNDWGSQAIDIMELSIRKIGENTRYKNPTVILSSYNAG